MAQEQKESIDSVHEQFKKLGFCFRTGVLEDFLKLSESELEDLYKKFKNASDGEKSLSRRKFSDIMHRCFPRTHKVRTLFVAWFRLEGLCV